MPDSGDSCEHDSPVANLITSVIFVGLLVAMIILAGRTQPQWTSSDGSRFIAHACLTLDASGRQGRWTRVHGRVGAGGVSLRQSFLAATLVSGTYVVVGRHEARNPRWVIYELQGPHPVHLKVRASGTLATLLDSLVSG